MAINTNLIISARQPFLNPDGTVQAQWFRFLEALSQSTAGQQYTTADLFALQAARPQTPAGMATKDGVQDALTWAMTRRQTAGLASKAEVEDAMTWAWVHR